MPEDNKIEEFLQKLAPCIGRGEFYECVEETARLAQDVGMNAPDLLNLSTQMGEKGKYKIMYVLTLAAAQGIEGKEKSLAYSNAGIAAQAIGKLEEAENYFNKALELNPKYAEAHNNYAILLDKLGKKNESEEYYKQAIKLNPKFAEPFYNYALLLEELGRKTEAEDYYKKAIEANPKDVSARNNYAALLSELDRKNEAEEQFKKALGLNPKNVNVLNNYANLLKETLRFHEAETEIRTALQIAPTDPYALGTLGDILADEGYFGEAIKQYQKSLKNSASAKNSVVSEIHNNLGWVYAQLKQHSKAKEEFGTAIKFDNMNIKAIRNHRKLSKVEFNSEISIVQIFLGVLVLLSLFLSYVLFLNSKLSDTLFTSQIVILISLLIIIFLYPQIEKVKIGTSGIEFEKNPSGFVEAKSQPIEIFEK